MKYYWIASTIEIKKAVLPCREINTKKYAILLILSHFRPCMLVFKVILLIILIDLLSQFIDHFYNIFRSSKSGPCLLAVKVKLMVWKAKAFVPSMHLKDSRFVS